MLRRRDTTNIIAANIMIIHMLLCAYLPSIFQSNYQVLPETFVMVESCRTCGRAFLSLAGRFSRALGRLTFMRRKVHSGRRKVLSVRAKWTQGEPHFRGLGLPLQRGDAGGGWRIFTFYCPSKAQTASLAYCSLATRLQARLHAWPTVFTHLCLNKLRLHD